MNQVLHILRKDVRHLWIEIALSFAGLVWLARINWLSSSPHFVARWYEKEYYPVFFVVLVWWFLITRLVQEESLAGDRQFWITRPYEWPQLLVEKLLFVFLVIYVPTLLIYCLLLRLAHFSLMERIADIIGANSLAAVFLVVPAAALATLTRKFAHWLLAILGMVLWVVGMVFLDDYLGRPSMSSEDIFEFLQAASFLTFAVIVILTQYAHRRTSRAWAFMLAALVAVPILMIATPFRAVVDHEYPLATDRPVVLALRPPTKSERHFLPEHKGKAYLILPLQISGISKGEIIDPNGAFITIDGSNIHWSSPWQSVGAYLYPDSAGMEIRIEVDSRIYEQVKNTTSRVHLTVAFSELKMVSQQTIPAQDKFDLPGVGNCWANLPFSYFSDSVECRTAGFSNYHLMTLSSDTSTCPRDEQSSQLPSGLTARSLYGENGPEPLMPLGTVNFFASTWDQATDKSIARPHICPGTPLAFSTYERARKLRLDYDLGEVRLGDYYQPSEDIGSYEFGAVAR